MALSFELVESLMEESDSELQLIPTLYGLEEMSVEDMGLDFFSVPPSPEVAGDCRFADPGDHSLGKRDC